MEETPMEPTEEKEKLVSVTIRRPFYLSRFKPPLKPVIVDASSSSVVKEDIPSPSSEASPFTSPTKEPNSPDSDEMFAKAIEKCDKRIKEGYLLEPSDDSSSSDDFKTEPSDFEMNGDFNFSMNLEPASPSPNRENHPPLSPPRSPVIAPPPMKKFRGVTRDMSNKTNPAATSFVSVPLTNNIDTSTGPETSSSSYSPRKPLQDKTDDGKKFYTAMFAKPSTRKHKIWEGDGFIIVSGRSVTLKNSDGEILGTNAKFQLTEEMLTEMKVFKFGGKEVQIHDQIPDNPFGDDGKPQPEEQVEINSKNLIVRPREMAVYRPSSPKTPLQDITDDGKKFYTAMFAKPSTRKHKIWEGDGFIIVSGRSVTLKNSDGEILGTNAKFQLTEEMLTEMKAFKFGGKEVQIHDQIPDNPFGDDGKPQPEEQVDINSKNIIVRAGEMAVCRPSSPREPLRDITDDGKKFYTAMFAKPSTRKHKIWEGDGFIIVSGSSVTLKNATGKVLGTNAKFQLTEEMLTEMKVFKFGGKEVQIHDQVPDNPFGDDEKPEEPEKWQFTDLLIARTFGKI